MHAFNYFNFTKNYRMKKDEVPQDLSSLGKITKEVCYATDESGKYTTEIKQGLECKNKCIDVTWEDIEQKIECSQSKSVDTMKQAQFFFLWRRM